MKVTMTSVGGKELQQYLKNKSKELVRKIKQETYASG
ncbi:unnamed protein product, partial [marine sediment metagenome]